MLIKIICKQESIPVGSTQPLGNCTCFQFQWPPPDLTPGDRFKQVPSDHHQMPLVGVDYSQGLMSGEGV